tara:strand:+ start:800 stop:1336 length:537 start_codon:yes stop_codon:yes gene_type:complete
MIEIEKCLKVIKSGGIILYPTDTIYGLGCDGYNLDAIRKINILKGSDPKKPLIYLMNDLKMVKKYVKNIPDFAIDFLLREKPTTLIFKNLKSTKLSGASIAVRIPKNKFCLNIISRLNNPITSTSANTSGLPFPKSINEIDNIIIEQVDYFVKTDKVGKLKPSSLIEIKDNLSFEKIR